MEIVRWLFLGIRKDRATTGEVAVGRTQTRLGRWWDRHPVALRLIAVLALIWGSVYLVWRIGWSWRGADVWLSVPLLVTEVYGLGNLAMLTWFGWRVEPSVRPTPQRDRAVDVYVCTYNEHESVLRATLVGCAAMTYPHTTYLLDDGRRPEMEQLAHELGAQYMTRADNSHAKAGNINAALPRTTGELVFVLDADHVPLPDALDALVGYFDDEEVALVQTPHDFYNHDSVQHYQVGRHEQSVFYSVIMPGKDRHGAAFWCGSGALIHRGALSDVGGVAVDTIAEDFHTTIKLHHAGWKSRYHDEVLVQGLAPHDLCSYLLQRDRWARGNLAVFTTPESPLRARGLSKAQRLSYFASLTSYLAGPMRLVTLATLVAVLWSGQLPLHATLMTLGLLWAPATLLSIGAGSALCRGYQRIADTTHFELSTAQIYARALRCAVRPGRVKFKVTPKEGVDHGGREALRQLSVIVLLALLLGSGVAARVANDCGLHLIPQLHGIALWVVPVLGGIELRRVLRTLTLVGARRQLRNQYRVALNTPAKISTADGAHRSMIGRTRDIAPSGIGLHLPSQVAPGATLYVTVEVPSLAGPTSKVPLRLEVTSCRPDREGWSVGTLITGADSVARRRVYEYCYVLVPWHRLRGTETVGLAPTPEPGTLATSPGLAGVALYQLERPLPEADEPAVPVLP